MTIQSNVYLHPNAKASATCRQVEQQTQRMAIMYKGHVRLVTHNTFSGQHYKAHQLPNAG